MAQAYSGVFQLEVDNSDFTAALRVLCKTDRFAKMMRIAYRDGMLTLTLGRTSREVSASGSWPHPVTVVRLWATTLIKRPYPIAVMLLRQSDGILEARDFRTPCVLDSWSEDAEAATELANAIGEACSVLGGLGVTSGGIRRLVSEADPVIVELWGPADRELLAEVADQWKSMAAYGVEPSDIKRLIDQKSRGLWSIGKRSGGAHSLFQRYGVTAAEEQQLIQNGVPSKAELLRAFSPRSLGPIAGAWRHLAVYGVEPTQIIGLILRQRRTKPPTPRLPRSC